MQRRNSRSRKDELLHAHDGVAEDKRPFLRAPLQLEGRDSSSHRDPFSPKSGPCSEIPSEEALCFPLESNRGVQEDQTSKLGTQN